LGAIGVDNKAFVVLANNNAQTVISFRNIPNVKTAQTNTINVYDIVNANKVVIALDAVKAIEEVYA